MVRVDAVNEQSEKKPTKLLQSKIKRKNILAKGQGSF